MVSFRAPDYVVIVVRDLERSLRFYCDVLGLPLGHRSGSFAQLATGVTRVALYERSAMAATLGRELEPPSPDAPGFELGFKVEDCDAAYDEPSRRHSAVPPTDRRGPAHRLLRDPDGHRGAGAGSGRDLSRRGTHRATGRRRSRARLRNADVVLGTARKRWAARWLTVDDASTSTRTTTPFHPLRSGPTASQGVLGDVAQAAEMYVVSASSVPDTMTSLLTSRRRSRSARGAVAAGAPSPRPTCADDTPAHSASIRRTIPRRVAGCC
jgi:catechol 2,3-dioxygenase-like lactoylglutathione lyase family enzyme